MSLLSISTMQHMVKIILQPEKVILEMQRCQPLTTMADVRMRQIPQSYQLRHSQLAPAMPCSRKQIIPHTVVFLIRSKPKFFHRTIILQKKHPRSVSLALKNQVSSSSGSSDIYSTRRHIAHFFLALSFDYSNLTM